MPHIASHRDACRKMSSIGSIGVGGCDVCSTAALIQPDVLADGTVYYEAGRGLNFC
jgi:hypothetical protein